MDPQTMAFLAQVKDPAAAVLLGWNILELIRVRKHLGRLYTRTDDHADRLARVETRVGGKARAAGALLLMAVLLAGCAMSKPVSLKVQEGGIEIDGLGRIWGKDLRYRSGILEEDEAGVTFEGKASGYAAPTSPPAVPAK